MSSIIGQMGETGASGASGAGGSFGSMLGSLGSSIGSLFGGGGFGTATPTTPTPPTVDNPMVTGGLPAYVPTSLPGGDPLASISAAANPGAAIGAIGSPSGASIPGTGTPSLTTPSATEITTGAAPGSAVTGSTPDPMGTGTSPAQASLLHNILFGSPAGTSTGATGTAATGAGGKGWPGLLSPAGLALMGGGITDLLKYEQQQSLLSPSDLAKASQAMAKSQAAQLRKSIMPQLTAQGQETGQINAPYLMNQAYTAAIGPVLAQLQTEAMNQWLEANRLAGGMYPSSNDISALGGLVSPSIFGGGAS